MSMVIVTFQTQRLSCCESKICMYMCIKLYSKMNTGLLIFPVNTMQLELPKIYNCASRHVVYNVHELGFSVSPAG
jgi:hypothetical protein